MEDLPPQSGLNGGFMKKKTLFLLLLAFAAFPVIAQTGIIREFSGEVELKRAGASNYVKAKQGDKVAEDTIVSTGFKSAAIIEVGNSTIAVKALTRLSLSEIQSAQDTETLNLKLQTGRVKVDVKPPAGAKANCTVQSPMATASVRGTSFEFDTVNLKVNEGSVAFRGSRGFGLIIPAGMASAISADGKAVDPLGSDSVTSQKPVKSPNPQPLPSDNAVDITIYW
jgi:hypothetical protein